MSFESDWDEDELQELFDALSMQKPVLMFIDDEELGHQLRVRRVYDRLTQTALARHLGISVGLLSEIERCIREVPARKMDDVSDYLYNQMYDGEKFYDYYDD